MSTGVELYEPITTGLLLLFVVSWLSIFDQVSPTTLAHGLQATGSHMILIVVMGLCTYVIMAFPIAFFYIILIDPYANPREAIFIPVDVPIDFLSWVPLEVGVVAFALAFLHIVTGGEDYANS